MQRKRRTKGTEEGSGSHASKRRIKGTEEEGEGGRPIGSTSL